MTGDRLQAGEEFCEAHWERRREQVPAYRLGLCLDCFRGRPIDRIETLGGLAPIEERQRANRKSRRYQRGHREETRAYQRGWKARNPEKQRLYERAYQEGLKFSDNAASRTGNQPQRPQNTQR